MSWDVPPACSGPSARPLRALPRVPCPPLAPLPLRCATPPRPSDPATVWHTRAVYQGHEEKKIVEKIFLGVCQIFVPGRSGMPPACSRPPARPLRSLPRVPCPRLSHLCLAGIDLFREIAARTLLNPRMFHRRDTAIVPNDLASASTKPIQRSRNFRDHGVLTEHSHNYVLGSGRGGMRGQYQSRTRVLVPCYQQG